MSDFDTVERIARQMCEEHGGAGHWDAKGTKRAHWRKRAESLLLIRDASSDPGLMAQLMRVIGWLV